MSQIQHDNIFLDPPRAPFVGTPEPSVRTSSPSNSSPLLPPINNNEPDEYPEERVRSGAAMHKRRSPVIWIASLAALIIVVLAVILPVYFTVIKPNQNHHVDAATGSNPPSSGSGSSGSSGTGGSSGSNGSGPSAITGGDGSLVTTADGSTFTYKNQFGGFWYSDPNDPFNNNAMANSWTPPLNKSWTYGTDQIYGVNLGGWLVLEPFIAPALFQKYPGTIDEWTLSIAMTNDTSPGGGIQQIEDHYNTFITEQDIAEIAGAGLNWVRVPLPFWAIETWPGEPHLPKVAWKYFLRLVGWCRKYGIRINLDLHTIPGSQNGYNHSGKDGSVNFLNGVMGIANAQRALDYIRIITEFISQPEYKDVIPMFGIMNEALMKVIGRDQLTSFYLQAHTMIRSITGIGEGNGPFISIHDGFQPDSTWAGFLTGSDRIALDSHPYFAFDSLPNNQPIATGTGANAGGIWPAQACHAWGNELGNSQSTFGFTFAGEFSNGYNDCGLYLRGVGGQALYGDCTLWQDSTNWNDTVKEGVMAFGLASMDTLKNWFFWTWKIGNSSTTGVVESPLWSYQLGLQGGWVAPDPRTSQGRCAALGVNLVTFTGPYQPWQTGGAGAGSIAASSTAQFPFPPATISNVDVAVSLLPTYTQTGTVPTLPPPTLTPTPTSSVNVGNGWFDAQDTASDYATKSGCAYPNAWNAVTASVPPPC